MAERDLKFTVAKLSCRYHMVADDDDELCTFKESSVGQCKIWLCPLVQKFGIQVGSKEESFEVDE